MLEICLWTVNMFQTPFRVLSHCRLHVYCNCALVVTNNNFWQTFLQASENKHKLVVGKLWVITSLLARATARCSAVKYCYQYSRSECRGRLKNTINFVQWAGRKEGSPKAPWLEPLMTWKQSGHDHDCSPSHHLVSPLACRFFFALWK